MEVQIFRRKGTILRGKSGRPKTCPAVDILKTTHQEQNRYGAAADWGVLGGVHIDSQAVMPPFHLITLQYYSLLIFFIRKLTSGSLQLCPEIIDNILIVSEFM